MSSQPFTTCVGVTTSPLANEVVAELGRGLPELLKRPRLELAHALAGDPELPADVLERLRVAAGQAEAALEDVAEPRLEAIERLPNLD